MIFLQSSVTVPYVHSYWHDCFQNQIGFRAPKYNPRPDSLTAAIDHDTKTREACPFDHLPLSFKVTIFSMGVNDYDSCIEEVFLLSTGAYTELTTICSGVFRSQTMFLCLCQLSHEETGQTFYPTCAIVSFFNSLARRLARVYVDRTWLNTKVERNLGSSAGYDVCQ